MNVKIRWGFGLVFGAMVLLLAAVEFPARGQGEGNRDDVRSRGVYGPDDRVDWFDIKDQNVLALAHATVALFQASGVQVGANGLVKLKTESLVDARELCPDQKFASQPTGAFCSGTLVAPDLVLTAGHCVSEVSGNPGPRVTAVRFVFGYRMLSETSLAAIGDAQVFAGKEVVDGNYSPNGADWALVRLARPVPASIAQPAVVSDAPSVSKDQKVFMIGFPSGLPLKYAANATVRNVLPSYFVANLDAFRGNSGSGVYDQATNKLIGVLVRGDADYRSDRARSCNVVFQCSNEGCSGESATAIGMVRIPK